MVATDRLAAALGKLEVGAWLDAETEANAAHATEPEDPKASLLLGLAIAAMGEADRAAPALQKVAELLPDAPHPCLELMALKPRLPLTLIRRQFEACLRRAPADARLRLAFAEFLLDNDWAQQAEAVLTDPALAGMPQSAASHHLCGLAQAEQGHFKAASVSFRMAVELDPDAGASWSDLGVTLNAERQFDAAIDAHDQAVAIAPDNPIFRINRAVTLLQAGHWNLAWQDYEWRLKLGGAAAFDIGRLLPSLADLGDLHGLTIIALHEEGFGDTMQFLRYLPLLSERGAQVVACVPQPLVRLMAAVPGVARVVADIRQVPAYDYVCPFFSLPRVFGTTVDTIPPPPLLRPDVAQVRHWMQEMPKDGLLAGIVWAGQSRPWLPGFRALDRRRSAGLAAFAPLSGVPGIRLISLQAGQAARQTPPAGMTLFDPMAEVSEFAETAEIIAALDVIVSVDTSVVHLAGLLGKPVFLLDRYDGCWRWLSGRRDSPWYPKLTIFRQDQPGDWSAPMARVAAALDGMALYHGKGERVRQTSAMREPRLVAIDHGSNSGAGSMSLR